MTDKITECPAIEIKNLVKAYGVKRALDNVSFSVKRGEVMGFLGPNGAGKSTTMNIICGYLAASEGQVFVNGVNAADNPMEAKRAIGYLPEQPPLYMDMTVLEYLSFVFDLKGVKAKREAHLRKIMEKVQIYEVRGRLIRNLSKGYKQRVGLAQALVGDPDILILDEPTVGLDPKQIMEIRDVISELGRERTVILSTHILQEVMAVCDSYTIINKGRIAATGSMDEFSGMAADSLKLRVKAEPEVALKIATSAAGVASAEVTGSFERETCDIVITAKEGADVREALFYEFANAGVPLLSMAVTFRTLEEVFMRAISEDSPEPIEENVTENTQKEEAAE